MPSEPKIGDHALLCERCGYALEGIAHDSACPECGTPIAQSLPQRRTGTPWQRAPGARALLATWWMALRHPNRTLRIARVRDGESLHAVTILVASALAGFGFGLLSLCIGIAEGGDPDRIDWVVALVMALLVIPLATGLLTFAVFFALTAIEGAGLRVIGRQRGMRITREIARVIVAHGSVGWFIAAMAPWAMTAGVLLHTFWRDQATLATPTPIALRLLMFALPLLLLATGFLVFEVFAYLGLRGMKFANRMPGDRGAGSGPHQG